MLQSITRFLVSLAAPFILIFGGAGLVGVGAEYDIDILLWAGGIVLICGLLWIGWCYLLAGGGG